MAEIQVSASGRKRAKLTTPRIDLTPMVDLGFLLITFFMYTTTLARPKVLELQMPYNSVPSVIIPGEATLIPLPGTGHQVAYYRGLNDPAESLDRRGFSGKNSLRILLQEEVIRVRSLPSSFSKEAHKLHVIIRPDTAAAYEDIVRTLDELAIAEVPYYTLMHITPAEQAAIKKMSAGDYGK